MIQDWPTEAWSYGGGVVLSAFALIWAARLSTAYQLVLDRKARKATITVRSLWHRGTTQWELANGTGVLRRAEHPIETADLHWVSLSMADGREIVLFDAPARDGLRSDEADRIAAEIGSFLNLPVIDSRRAKTFLGDSRRQCVEATITRSQS